MAVSDTFERADNPASLGAADTGELWTPRPTAPHDNIDLGNPIAQITSVLGIDDGRAYSTDASRVHLATIDHGTPEVDVSLELALPFAAGSGAGMVVRWQGPTQFFECFAYRRNTVPQNYYAIVRRVDSATAWEIMPEVASVFLANDIESGPHTLGIRVTGPEWSFSWDGVDAGSFSDAAYPDAVEHGVLTYFTTARIIEAFVGLEAPSGFSVGMVAI